MTDAGKGPQANGDNPAPNGVPSGGDTLGGDPTGNDGTAGADAPAGDAGAAEDEVSLAGDWVEKDGAVVDSDVDELLPEAEPTDGKAPLP